MIRSPWLFYRSQLAEVHFSSSKWQKQCYFLPSLSPSDPVFLSKCLIVNDSWNLRKINNNTPWILSCSRRHTHTHTVRAEESYSLWCMLIWHVKVNTRIANHTLVSGLWGLPVTCLFAFFHPRQRRKKNFLLARTRKHTFQLRCGKRTDSVCRRHEEAGWTKFVFSPLPNRSHGGYVCFWHQ